MNDEYSIYADSIEIGNVSKQGYNVLDHYGRITDDYTIPAATYLDTIRELSKHYSTSFVMEEKTLYAVKEQIEWAHKVYMNMNDELNSIERRLLRKVIGNGKYLPTDRGLLNELLRKYK